MSKRGSGASVDQDLGRTRRPSDFGPPNFDRSREGRT